VRRAAHGAVHVVVGLAFQNAFPALVVVACRLRAGKPGCVPAAVLASPRCASTSCCAGENAAHSAVTGASNCALNAAKVGMKAALLGSSTSSNMAAGTRGVLVQSQ